MSMGPVRSEIVNDNLIEERYWCGKFIVYINNRKFNGSFEEAVKKYEEQRIPRR